MNFCKYERRIIFLGAKLCLFINKILTSETCKSFTFRAGINFDNDDDSEFSVRRQARAIARSIVEPFGRSLSEYWRPVSYRHR